MTRPGAGWSRTGPRAAPHRAPADRGGRGVSMNLLTQKQPVRQPERRERSECHAAQMQQMQQPQQQMIGQQKTALCSIGATPARSPPPASCVRPNQCRRCLLCPPTHVTGDKTWWVGTRSRTGAGSGETPSKCGHQCRISAIQFAVIKLNHLFESMDHIRAHPEIRCVS